MIKIDRSFIARLGSDEATPALARNIIRMGLALDLQIVAEGVETTDQYHQLQTLGCQLAQGFLFARAVDERTARAMLTEKGLHPAGRRPT